MLNYELSIIRRGFTGSARRSYMLSKRAPIQSDISLPLIPPIKYFLDPGLIKFNLHVGKKCTKSTKSKDKIKVKFYISDLE